MSGTEIVTLSGTHKKCGQFASRDVERHPQNVRVCRGAPWKVVGAFQKVLMLIGIG